MSKISRECADSIVGWVITICFTNPLRNSWTAAAQANQVFPVLGGPSQSKRGMVLFCKWRTYLRWFGPHGEIDMIFVWKGFFVWKGIFVKKLRGYKNIWKGGKMERVVIYLGHYILKYSKSDACKKQMRSSYVVQRPSDSKRPRQQLLRLATGK